MRQKKSSGRRQVFRVHAVGSGRYSELLATPATCRTLLFGRRNNNGYFKPKCFFTNATMAACASVIEG